MIQEKITINFEGLKLNRVNIVGKNLVEKYWNICGYSWKSSAKPLLQYILLSVL